MTGTLLAAAVSIKVPVRLLASTCPTGRWGVGRRECDHFFGAGPRTLLFLSLLHQQTQTERTPVKQFWKDPQAFAKSTPQAPSLSLHPQRQGDVVGEAVCHTQPVAGLQAHSCCLLEAVVLGSLAARCFLNARDQGVYSSQLVTSGDRTNGLGST